MIGKQTAQNVSLVEEEKKPISSSPSPSAKEESKTGAKSSGSSNIVTYASPWKVYALGHSWRQDMPLRFGLGSFIEGKDNKVEIVEFSEATRTLARTHVVDHQYTPTKLLWIPDKVSSPIR